MAFLTELFDWLKTNTWKTNLYIIISVLSFYWVWGLVVWVVMDVLLKPYQMTISAVILGIADPSLRSIEAFVFAIIIVFGTLFPLVYCYARFSTWFVAKFDLNDDRKHSIVPVTKEVS